LETLAAAYNKNVNNHPSLAAIAKNLFVAATESATSNASEASHTARAACM
jgi:hypothetical protein